MSGWRDRPKAVPVVGPVAGRVWQAVRRRPAAPGPAA